MADIFDMVKDLVEERDCLRQVNQHLLDDLDAKEAEIKRLKLALSTGLMVSRNEDKRQRSNDVLRLHEQGLTYKAIELQLFGYKGGYAYRFVSRTIAEYARYGKRESGGDSDRAIGSWSQ